MRFQMRQRAGEHERFTRSAFDHLIGGEVPFKIDGKRRGVAVLRAVEVVDDGQAALLTYDVPSRPDGLVGPGVEQSAVQAAPIGFSFGFHTAG